MALLATGTSPLLSVQDLRIAFGAHEAVHGVSFDIAAGRTLGLVGESGSGKSATSLALMGLLPPTASASGRAMLLNDTGQTAFPDRQPHLVREGDAMRNVSPLPEGHAEAMHPSYPRMSFSVGYDLLNQGKPGNRVVRGSEIAMIFQEPMTALNPVMKVGRQIAEAVEAHHPKLRRAEVRERVLQAMREVALPDPERRMDDYPHQFSGGQRQRIMIAMAIINKPRLLIADEPTTALDVTVQAQILTLLRHLQQQHGLAMLFISHDLAVVSQIADHVAVMQHGSVVEQGPAAGIFRNPQHAYTRRLLRSAPTMETARDRPLAEGAEGRM